MSREYKTLEEKRAIIARFNLIDDPFFAKVIDDTDASEELLQTLLCDSTIRVVEANTQLALRNAGSRSVVLDALCKSEDGRYFNVEVQTSDSGNHQRRMRYHVSNLDTMLTEKGVAFDQIPDVFAIMICKFDVFGKGKVLYYIDRVLRDYNTVQDNGVREIYVNALGEDGTPVSDLMQYMLNSNGYSEKFPRISRRVQYFKEIKEGDMAMGSVVDELIAEGKSIGIAEGIAETLKVLGVSEAEYQKKLEAQKKQ